MPQINFLMGLMSTILMKLYGKIKMSNIFKRYRYFKVFYHWPYSCTIYNIIVK